MKNIFKKLSVCLLALCMVFPMVSCNKTDSTSGGDSTGGTSSGGTSSGEDLTPVKYNPETRPLKMSVSALDGNFNPFFYTAAPDGEIVSMTQIGMLSTDNDGNVACGEDEPTVVLDYKITSYTSSGAVTTGDNADHTTYEFVIKNGIKFSDGVELTIKDVLFNLYVYLDKMYTGSSTIYSTDIRGLKAYRENDASLKDDSNVNTDAVFRAAAQQRISNMVDWSNGDLDETDEIREDVVKVQTQFRKDLQTDWTANYGQLKSYEDQYNFTSDWQSFYLMEGLVTVNSIQSANGNWVDEIRDENGNLVSNIEDGKYVTNLDDPNDELTSEMNAALSDEAKIAEYMTEYNCNRETALEYIERDVAIETAYAAYADEVAIKSSIITILYGTTTGTNILQEFIAEERDKFFKEQEGQGKEDVDSISGIETYKTSTFDGVEGAVLTEEHDVLKVTINGVDPKAIWNFGFVVAPMHYYSNAETIASTPYGVKARDKSFFDTVLKATSKNALPVGAGVYRASTEKGNASEDPSKVKGSEFWSNKSVYFQRNDYFYTVGSGLCNAKIKYFTYVEVGENNILNRLIAQEIDYGTPGATQNNLNEISSKSDYLSYKLYQTNGYGYVGVNPKYVPEVEVRRAIMKAMDTASIIDNYYYGGLAEVIYRPMTKLSWAYPKDANGKEVGEYDKIAYDPTGSEIEALVQKAGYKKGSDGIYAKNGSKLEIKFTIAGETTDHPAYAMFNKASQLLNQHGFKITVGTDVGALKKLATGGLAVWAAAWTSTVDPDMYQIYHKDTTATSRYNWNYDEILNDSTGKFDYEKEVIGELSDLIEAGRETNNRQERTEIYAQALNLIMDLAVELPTYQRNDLAVFNSEIINPKTLNQEQELKYSSPVTEIWLVNYN